MHINMDLIASKNGMKVITSGKRVLFQSQPEILWKLAQVTSSSLWSAFSELPLEENDSFPVLEENTDGIYYLSLQTVEEVKSRLPSPEMRHALYKDCSIKNVACTTHSRSSTL